jgi:hypothetical protein
MGHMVRRNMSPPIVGIMRSFLRQFALAVMLTVGVAVSGLAPAQAAYVTASWNFLSPAGTVNPGCSTAATCAHTYSPSSGSSPYNITATAFYNSGIAPSNIGSHQNFTSHTNWTAESLYGKNLGAGEKGLGINSDITGQHEIYGTHFIQIAVGNLATVFHSFLFSMNSSTQSEAWAVYGSNSTGNGATLTFLIAGTDSATHSLSTAYKYYDFFYNSALGSQSGQGNNVLLQTFTATNTPLPPALALFTTGLGVVGLLGWRRKRKNAAGTVTT